MMIEKHSDPDNAPESLDSPPAEGLHREPPGAASPEKTEDGPRSATPESNELPPETNTDSDWSPEPGQPIRDKERSDRAHNQVSTFHEKASRAVSRLAPELIEDALHETHGNIYEASKLLGTSYVHMARVIDNTHHLIALCESYRTQMLDIAEANLRASLEQGNMKSTYYTLTRLGKERGYAERKEVETTVTQKQAVDLGKLSTDQLTRLREVMVEAGIGSGELIDVTPESVDEGWGEGAPESLDY